MLRVLPPVSNGPSIRPISYDHIIAEQHGGSDDFENLAYCCSRCNFSKGPNLSGIDPKTGKIVTLFNPRTESWTDHFEQRAGLIIGITPAGRPPLPCWA